MSVIRSGDSIVINGEVYDFSPLADGDTLPATAINSQWFAGQVDRVDGQLALTIFLPLPSNFSPEQAYPKPLLDVPDGVVTLPEPLADPAVAMEADK